MGAWYLGKGDLGKGDLNSALKVLWHLLSLLELLPYFFHTMAWTQSHFSKCSKSLAAKFDDSLDVFVMRNQSRNEHKSLSISLIKAAENLLLDIKRD